MWETFSMWNDIRHRIGIPNMLMGITLLPRKFRIVILFKSNSTPSLNIVGIVFFPSDILYKKNSSNQSTNTISIKWRITIASLTSNVKLSSSSSLRSIKEPVITEICHFCNDGNFLHFVECQQIIVFYAIVQKILAWLQF